MSAAGYGECDIVKDLLSLGANVDIQNNVRAYLWAMILHKVVP